LSYARKAARGIRGRKGLLARLEKQVALLKPAGKRVWFHSSSMGEFEQAKPILEKLSASMRYIGPAGKAAEVKALVNMVMNINTAALAAGAQNWMLHRTTMAERVLLILAGLLLVFPSLIEAAAEGLSGYDLPHPAPFGLAIMAILLARQWITRAKPAKA